MFPTGTARAASAEHEGRACSADSIQAYTGVMLSLGEFCFGGGRVVTFF